MEHLKRIVCDPDCGFMVQSHNEDEVMHMGEEHAKNIHHDNSITKEKLSAMMKDV